MKSEEEIKNIEAAIDQLLHTVMDPEVELNIVDLGLIYSLVYDGENGVEIKMTLSTPACPLGDAIIANVKQTIHNKFPEFVVDVQLVFDPPWSAAMISEQGKAKLRM
jgi:metal-sulfur cluster biosynthetic enzyme